ncbi:MAG: hypothetical protein IPN79_09895 [Saprospiraceae bacterium]|nr:hypothetical protein [Saprospiraceae bacterium]
MITKTSIIFKITDSPELLNTHIDAKYQTELHEKPILKEEYPIYTVIQTGIIKENDKWYEYMIEHVHNFSMIHEPMIQRELDKTLKVQKLILSFYKENPINYLNDPTL